MANRLRPKETCWTCLISLLIRKGRSWLKRPLSEKIWFFIAYPLLGFARFCLMILPFRIIARILGHYRQGAPYVPLANPDQMRRALTIGRAIQTAASHTPWKSECLVQAVVASLLLKLNQTPHGVYLGMRKNPSSPNGMLAHAWVSSGSVAVTGEYGFDQFTVIGNFIYL